MVIIILVTYRNSRNSRFKKSDAFIGFQKDTPASVVFQATNLFRSACAAMNKEGHCTEGRWADILHWSKVSPHIHMEEDREQKAKEEAVSS